MAVFVLYVTFPTKRNAVSIIDKLLDRKLIACATMFSVESRFLWKGKKEVGDEWVAYMKTSNPIAAQHAILKLHPYDVPCVLVIKVGSNKKYKDWVMSICK